MNASFMGKWIRIGFIMDINSYMISSVHELQYIILSTYPKFMDQGLSLFMIENWLYEFNSENKKEFNLNVIN